MKICLASLDASHKGEINTNEVSEYFQKIFYNKRGHPREPLMKLSANQARWEFSGSTDNIFQVADELFNFKTVVPNRTTMVGIQGGSGERLLNFLWNTVVLTFIFQNKGSGKSFFLDNLSGAINGKTLFSLATKNSSFGEERKECLRKQCDQWGNRMFALNISFNGFTNINHFPTKQLRAFIPEDQIENEVALRILFTL